MDSFKDFETLGRFALAAEAFSAQIAKDESWVPQVAYLFENKGSSCITFRMATKVMNIESQSDLKEKVDILFKLISDLKKLSDEFPTERFWEKGEC